MKEPSAVSHVCAARFRLCMFWCRRSLFLSWCWAGRPGLPSAAEAWVELVLPALRLPASCPGRGAGRELLSAVCTLARLRFGLLFYRGLCCRYGLREDEALGPQCLHLGLRAPSRSEASPRQTRRSRSSRSPRCPSAGRGRFEGRGGSAAQLASQAFEGDELQRGGLG